MKTIMLNIQDEYDTFALKGIIGTYLSTVRPLYLHAVDSPDVNKESCTFKSMEAGIKLCRSIALQLGEKKHGNK